jgi:hypothetical protein
MSLSKELVEWAQREATYYTDAAKWKRIQDIMRNEEQVAEWKQELFTKKERDQEEIKKYTQEEINEAIRQIRID